MKPESEWFTPAAFSEKDRAQQSPSLDIGSIPEAAEYVACFGKARNLNRLSHLKNLKCLWISGINERQFESLCHVQSIDTLIVYDLRVPNMTGIERLKSLRCLIINGNTKTLTLDPVGELQNLEHCKIENFSKVKRLDPLGRLLKLRSLSVQGSIWTAMKISTLAPLQALQDLRAFSLLNVRVQDGSLAPLKQLRKLRSIEIANFFCLREFAELAGSHPLAVGDSLLPRISVGWPCKQCGSDMVMLARGKAPFLCPKCQKNEVDEHDREFNRIKSETAAQLERSA
ncbi:MAG: hypothetical protein WCS99_08470 [Limisphaerales bacterium]